jgi:hypothetical protein
MIKHLCYKTYLLLFAYSFLFIVSLMLNPFQLDIISASNCSNLYIQDDLENGRIVNVSSLENGAQKVIKINNIRNLSLNYLSNLLIFAEIITYPDHNSDLHFNSPQICFKFPLSEHTEEG